MKSVSFYLGPAIKLSGRRLTIIRTPNVKDIDGPPITPFYDQTLGGTVSAVTVSGLPDNQIYEARLVDTRTSGEISRTDALLFATGSLLFPGPKSGDRLAILSMGHDSSSSNSSSSPSSSLNRSLAPSSLVNGSALANVWDYGAGPAEIASGTTGTLFIYPRNPKVLICKSGTHLRFCELEYATGPDNSAAVIVCTRSLDKGKTFGDPIIVAKTTTYPGVALGVSIAINGFDPQQCSDGTIVLTYSEMPFDSTTAGVWYDFSGNTPAQTIGVKTRVLKCNDDGVTWKNVAGATTTLGTDVTSQLLWTDKRNQMAIASAASGTGSVYKIAVSGNATALIVGQFYRVRISGWTGTDHAAINYAENGGVAFYAKCVTDVGHLELQGTTFVATATGTALPQMAWFIVGGNGCVLRAGGAHADRVFVPFSSRFGCNADGQPTSQLAYADLADLTTWTPTAHDNTGETVGSVEGSCGELLTNGHILLDSRQTSGNNRVEFLSTDAGATLTYQGAIGAAASGAMGALLPLGNGKIALVAPGQPAFRQLLCAWIGTESPADTITWAAKPKRLNAGISGYSGGAIDASKNVFVDFERDYLDGGVNLTTPGRIGTVKTNVAYLTGNAADPPIILPFNDLPTGMPAWTNAIGFRDVGGLAAHAQVKGSPIFQAGGGCKFGTGDYAVVGKDGNNDFTYAPNALASDNGDFLYAIEFSIESNGNGLLASQNGSTVGTSAGATTQGWKVLCTGGNVAQVVLDDGVHNVTVSGAITVNDGGRYRAVVAFSGGGKAPLLTVYNAATGAQIDLATQGGAIPALGSIGNVTQATTLLRYGDTNTGRMSQNCTVYLSYFSRNINAALPPMPYVPPVAETFPAVIAGGPDDTSVVPAINQGFHAFPCDGGFGVRTQSLATPSLKTSGAGVCAVVDRVNGWYTNSVPIQRTKFPSGGGATHFPGSPNFHTFDARSINALADIHNFKSGTPFSILTKLFLPTGQPPVLTYVMSTWDGTNGFIFQQGMIASVAMGFSTAAFQCRWYPVGGLLANTEYLAALVFNGTGGAANAGLTSYLFPTAGPILLSNVTAGKNINFENLSGSTAATAVATTAALKIGDGTRVLTGDYGPFLIYKGYALTDANILSIANALLAA